MEKDRIIYISTKHEWSLDNLLNPNYPITRLINPTDKTK